MSMHRSLNVNNTNARSRLGQQQGTKRTSDIAEITNVNDYHIGTAPDKRVRTCIDSNYLYLANTISNQLMAMTEKIDRQLGKLNNRLDNLEVQVRKLNDELQTHIQTQQYTAGHVVTHMDTGDSIDDARSTTNCSADIAMIYA